MHRNIILFAALLCGCGGADRETPTDDPMFVTIVDVGPSEPKGGDLPRCERWEMHSVESQKPRAVEHQRAFVALESSAGLRASLSLDYARFLRWRAQVSPALSGSEAKGLSAGSAAGHLSSVQREIIFEGAQIPCESDDDCIQIVQSLVPLDTPIVLRASPRSGAEGEAQRELE